MKALDFTHVRAVRTVLTATRSAIAPVVFCIVCVAGSTSATAQSIDNGSASRVPDGMTAADALERETARRASTKAAVPRRAMPVTRIEPFGSNLFRGGFSSDGEDGLNPDYVLQPGDSVSVRIWGATQFESVLMLDPQGNIFLPTVGPVRLSGVRNRDLNARVSEAVQGVYTDNVRVYTSLNGAQPVGVFVTGYVREPGRFAGIPSNSVLYFIDRAGGVDATRGSFRDIHVLRDGKSVARIDLYGFLLTGELESVQFEDGDTIVVGARKSVVTVSGDVASSAEFEFTDNVEFGRNLIDLAQLDPGVSRVGVSGVRADGPFSTYIDLARFADFELQDGDRVHFVIDQHETTIVVHVEGEFFGPSRYAIPRDTRLHELLDHIAVDRQLANTDAVSLRRLSIAERQKKALEESLARLEAKYLTASSQTDRESAIRAQEASLIGEFVANARQVEPSGRLVVAQGDDIANVRLESGDVITIPDTSDSVLLSGEVLVSQALIHERGRRASYYIDRSGGFSDQASRDRIVLVHPNGAVTSAKDPVVEPGDEIIVLPKVPVKNLQVASTIVDILYKIAIAASVAVKL